MCGQIAVGVFRVVHIYRLLHTHKTLLKCTQLVHLLEKIAKKNKSEMYNYQSNINPSLLSECANGDILQPHVTLRSIVFSLLSCNVKRVARVAKLPLRQPATGKTTSKQSHAGK